MMGGVSNTAGNTSKPEVEDATWKMATTEILPSPKKPQCTSSASKGSVVSGIKENQKQDQFKEDLQVRPPVLWLYP